MASYLSVQVFSLGGVGLTQVNTASEPVLSEAQGMRILSFISDGMIVYGIIKRPNGWPVLRASGSIYIGGRMRSFKESVGIHPDGSILLDTRKVRA